MQTTILQLQMLVHMDVNETFIYLKSQIFGSVSLPGNWICLVTSPYPRMTQEKVLHFLMSCLETRLLACQRICCDHILEKIYLMKRGFQLQVRRSQTRCGMYLRNFEQQMAYSTFSHFCASKLCVHHSTVLLCFAQFC